MLVFLTSFVSRDPRVCFSPKLLRTTRIPFKFFGFLVLPMNPTVSTWPEFIRLPSPANEKPKAWQISNVLSKWTAQDVVRCLEGAGREDTTVVRRPSKRQPWIVLSRVISSEARQRLRQDVGWKAVWSAYNKDKWPGAHRIDFQGRRRVRPNGYVAHKRTCEDCGLEIDRGDIPKCGPCKQNPEAELAPPQTERIKLWRGFQQQKKIAMREARKVRYKGA